MKSAFRLLGTLLLATLLPQPLRAAELGAAAPALDVKEWIKGGPVTLAEGQGKTIYVVEFWATWCPPCRASIPHLTELQKKLKDKGVVFVGVSDEKPDVVKKFVEKMGDKMDYAVAIDGGKTSEGYMEAFGVQGIPHAFVVSKDGKIAWEGHPMAGLDKALDELVAGTYDLDAAKAKAKKKAAGEKQQAEAQKKLQQLAKLIMAGKDDEETKQLETELVALDKEAGGLLNGEAFEPADFRQRVLFSQKVRKYQQALMTAAEPAKLAELEAELKTGAPKDFDLEKFKAAMTQQMEARKHSALIEGYMKAVGEKGDAAKAKELAGKIEAANIQSGEALNALAWAILAEDEVKQRDLPFALKLAERANTLAGGKEPSVLDTYARALFDTGKTVEAIAQQKRAVELAEDEDLKAELKKTLAKYEAAK